MQFGGGLGRGAALPLLSTLLLAPVAVLRTRGPEDAPPPPPMIVVTGEVPESVRRLPNVIVDPRTRSWFREVEGQVRFTTPSVPDDVRVALDGGEKPVTIEFVKLHVDIPGRMMLIALIAGSLLTGGTSESLPGERSRKTLETLLAASVTREELVVGKWLAWSAIGVVSVLLASALAVALGRVTLGFWLLPLVTVPVATVALSLYLVRRTSDVIGASAITLRVMPVVLGSLGIGAWVLGTEHPLLGAALPLGGAAVAAGGTWPGVLPPLLATAVTAATTFACLWATARDLTADEGPPARLDPRVGMFAGITLSLLVSHWIAVAGPILWASGGNPHLTDELSPTKGILASALLTASTALWVSARDPAPLASLGLVRPKVSSFHTILASAIAAIGCLASGSAAGILPLPGDRFVSMARFRFAAALEPAWAGVLPAILLIVAQELVFRGYLRRRIGAWPAAVAFVVVVMPLDPVRGTILAAILGLLEWRTGTALAPMLARLAWLAIGLSPGFSPLAGLLAGGLAAVALWATPQGEPIEQPAAPG